jgi:hypothetical protein
LGKCSKATLIQPQLEYASSVWDPLYKTEIDELEKVQRRAIRFIKNSHDRTASVTSMQNELKLPTLQQRRQLSRLTIFYKAVNNEVAVELPDYLLISVRETRSYHHTLFTRISTRKNTYKYSYIPRTTSEWNDLPPDINDQSTIQSFKTALEDYLW